MNFLRINSIVGKIIFFACFLGIAFLLGMLFYFSNQTQSIFSDYVLNSDQTEVEIAAAEFEIVFRDIRSDVFTLASTPPIQGMFRAIANDGYDELGNSSVQVWKDRLATIFASLASSKEIYYQLRFIDEFGQELVRVDAMNGKPERVSESNLQNKADRFYFLEASKYSLGELYVSEPTLNREGTPPEIEVPYKPVLRFAAPVFDSTSVRRGMIIANVDFGAVLNRFSTNADSSADVIIVDQSGHYVYNADESKEWGGEEDLNTGENVIRDLPNLANHILSDLRFSFVDDEDAYFSKKVFLSEDNKDIFLAILKISPRVLIFSPFQQILYDSIFVGVLFLFIILLFFALVIRYMLHPLVELSNNAKEIGKGNFDKRIRIRSEDELGRLGIVFNAMAGSLQDLYRSLDAKVRERTKELEAARRQLKLATKSAGIGIWEWDVKKDKLIWDEEMFKLYGLDTGQTPTYKEWEQFVHPDDIKRINSMVDATLKKDVPYDTHFRILWSDGSMHFLRAFAYVLRDKKGKPVKLIGVNWDITKEKEVDKAKSEFVSLASHQLKTPLSSIRWNTEMLVAGDAGKMNKEQMDMVTEISDVNQHMIDLVNMLLNVSRIELGTFMIEPEPTDLGKLAKSVIRELKPMIKAKKLKVQVEVADDIDLIKVDPKLLRIVFQNLVSNAIKYTPEKGKVALSIYKKARRIFIEVADTGIGIPKKEQKRMFTKLFRAQNARDIDGTGLGLYIVKSILDHSGGTITFDSKENKGTTFVVSIPSSGMKKKVGSKSLS